MNGYSDETKRIIYKATRIITLPAAMGQVTGLECRRGRVVAFTESGIPMVVRVPTTPPFRDSVLLDIFGGRGAGEKQLAAELATWPDGDDAA